MKYLGRLLMTVFVLTCFTTLQVQAGTDAVIRFVGSQTDDVSVSNGQPVITFFPTGVKLSGSSVVLPYKSFKNISFGVARSSITVFDDGNISDLDPTHPVNVAVEVPSVKYPDPVILGNGVVPVEKSLANAKVYFSMPGYTYTGEPLTPSFSVYDDETQLVANTDFTYTYSNNLHAGEATLTLTGMGDYINTSKTASFYIDKSKLTVTAEDTTRIFGEPNPELTYLVSGFIASKDSSILESVVVQTTADSMSVVGDYPITVSGGSAQDYSFDYVEGVLTITPCDMSGARVTFDKDKYPYTGSPIIPTCKVIFKDTTLIAGTDYTLTCINNVQAGNASATIFGMGNYTGQIDTTFVIFEDHPIIAIVNGDTIKAQPSGSGYNYDCRPYGSVLVEKSDAKLGKMVKVYIMPETDYYVDEYAIDPKPDSVKVNGSKTSQLNLRFECQESDNITLSITFVEKALMGVAPALSAMPQPMTVYDMRGLMMTNAVVSSEDEIKACMEKLPSGLYIIRINNKTYKIQKK